MIDCRTDALQHGPSQERGSVGFVDVTAVTGE
jgi:hypothetical protein